jgi:hypothetical protein
MMGPRQMAQSLQIDTKIQDWPKPTKCSTDTNVEIHEIKGALKASHNQIARNHYASCKISALSSLVR